jgi:transcription initiation factor IIE alpha subunit
MIYVVATNIYPSNHITFVDVQLVNASSPHIAIGKAMINLMELYSNERITIPFVQEFSVERILFILKEEGITRTEDQSTPDYDREKMKQLISDSIEIAREKKTGCIKPLKEIARELNIYVEDI